MILHQGPFKDHNDTTNQAKQNLERDFDLFRRTEINVTTDNQCWKTFKTTKHTNPHQHKPKADQHERTLINNHLRAIDKWNISKTTRNYKEMLQEKTKRETYSKIIEDKERRIQAHKLNYYYAIGDFARAFRQVKFINKGNQSYSSHPLKKPATPSTSSNPHPHQHKTQPPPTPHNPATPIPPPQHKTCPMTP